MKLISMTDFVLQRSTKSIEEMTILEAFKYSAKITNEIFKYAKFLQQSLELWMFVPCDEYGNIIDESYNDKQHVIIQHLEYAEAKERCLFEGFDLDKANIYLELFSIIESLSILSKKVELTQTAINKLGL